MHGEIIIATYINWQTYLSSRMILLFERDVKYTFAITTR